MTNEGHSGTGYFWSATYVALLQFATPNPILGVTLAVIILAGIGSSLLNDIDSPNSVMSKSLGVVTRTASRGARWLSALVYRHTRWGCDPEESTYKHRGLFHTWQLPVVLGPAVALLVTAIPWSGPIVLCLVLAPAVRSIAWTLWNIGIGRWVRAQIGKLPSPSTGRGRSKSIAQTTVGRLLGLRERRSQWKIIRSFGGKDTRAGAALTWLQHNWRAREPLGAFALAVAIVTATVAIGGTVPYTGGAAWAFGFAVTVGMLNHNAGDGGTTMGTPWKAGVPHRCDYHRACFVNASCRWRRIPWHHCRACDQARQQFPTCAMWDRSHNTPRKLRFSVGESQWKERTVTWGSVLAGTAITVTAFL